jgi:hypothetical protein
MQRGEGALMAGAILKHPNALRFVHFFFWKDYLSKTLYLKLDCLVSS